MLVRRRRAAAGRRRDFRFVRHNDRNETLLCELADEAEALAEITAASASFGARLAANGNQVQVVLDIGRR